MYRLIDNANKVVLSAQCKYYYLRRESGIILSPFNINQLDNIKAYIERHSYISTKYPNLERTCRKLIFSSLLWGMRKAYRDNRIESNKEALLEVIDTVSNYDFRNCGLSADQENTLKLLFDDIENYITEMKLGDVK